MFFLRDKSKTKTSIILRFYISDIGTHFKYTTGQSIETNLWDQKKEGPKKSRGNKHPHLKPIQTKLDLLKKLFESYLRELAVENLKFDPILCKTYLDNEFKFKKVIASPGAPKYLHEFLEIFVNEAPNKINRNTKKKFTKSKITQYNKLKNKIIAFDKHRKKKVLLNEVDQKLYDTLYIYWQDEMKYSVNYIGSLFKNLRNVLKIAERDYKYIVHQEFKEKEFAVVQEDSLSIALSEKEITLIYNYDFSDSPRLQNARDWSIIGFWTGLRIGDLLELNISPDLKYIEIEPNKTSEHDINVIIPLHHHIKGILTNRGMPHKISDVKYNKYIKEVCEIVGLTEPTKGSLMNPETKRKEIGVYPKYKLVSSHTCRRSFATNMYLMNFPSLSIMKITGHKTEKSFLKYIKVTPKEHAEKLLAHWEEYYNKKSTNQ